MNKNDDELVIVLAHPNNSYRKRLLIECLQNTNKEILLSTNYFVDESIETLCDHVIYTKNNPILYKKDFEKYDVAYYSWRMQPDGTKNSTLFEYEHGYAVYTLIQNALRYAHSMGKKVAHIINYDYLIQETILNENYTELKNTDIILYKHTTTNYGEDSVSSGIISGKIDTLNDFFQIHKSIDEYYYGGNKDGFAILEGKLYRHYLKTNGIEVTYKVYEELKNTCVLDREGSFTFSKYNDLDGADFATISNTFECDKSTSHRYEYPYDKFLNKFREIPCSIFEIGIEYGKSLSVWETFLPKSKIYGMDIGIEMALDRGYVYMGDQSKLDDLKNISEKIGKCDIIIDDGSHVAEHQIKTFEFLFENMLDWGGVYVIEDIECSYWKPFNTVYGYATGDINIIDYFTKMNHAVNSHYSNHTNDLQIKSVSYYPNCIVIEKYQKDEIRTDEYIFRSLL